MCIKGEKKQHMKGQVKEKTYINIKKEINTMYVYKWLQDLMYKSKVSKKERKEKIQSILTTSLNKNNIPLNKDV